MGARAKVIATLLALSLAAPAWPQPAPAPAAPAQGQAQADEDKVEPRFIWGILINVAVSKLSNYAFSVFLEWLTPKLTAGLDAGTAAMIQRLTSRDSGARLTARSATPTAALAGGPAPIVVGNPDKPLVADGKKENFQGVHVGIMVSQDGGRNFAFRPVSEGFRTGERFKLRVVSTFGGEMTIDNINPRNERRQIFPPRADQVVTLIAGSETLVPMDGNQFFEFTGATGREQLVISLADPRAVGAAASRNKVFRQDTKFGSNFLQEVTGSTFPSIQQSIELVHSK